MWITPGRFAAAAMVDPALFRALMGVRGMTRSHWEVYGDESIQARVRAVLAGSRDLAPPGPTRDELLAVISASGH